MKLRKKTNLCVKTCFEAKHDLFWTSEGEKKHYVLVKDFNTFMYDDTLHHARKHFLLI